MSGSASAGYTVQVVGAGGGATTTSVSVGLVTTSYAQITNGLAAGDIVVTGTISARTGTTSAGGVNVNTLTGGGLSGGFGR